MGEDARLELTREDEVRNALRTVIDPEVGIDVVDLGLIREIHVDPITGAASVDLVLTTKGLPARGLPDRAGAAARGLPARDHLGRCPGPGRAMGLGAVPGPVRAPEGRYRGEERA